jgi:acyl-coenzyme A synthetase/AMP-(fatty) acid ligase
MCRCRLSSFSSVVFGPLPKTSTQKIQKFALREKAKDLND